VKPDSDRAGGLESAPQFTIQVVHFEDSPIEGASVYLLQEVQRSKEHSTAVLMEMTEGTRLLTVQITNLAVPCRVRARVHRGLKVEAGLVQLTQGIFSRSSHAADIETPSVMLFPGEAELNFTSVGYEPLQRAVVIEVPPQGEYHWIELDALPKPPR
jgi:hypothetical protein